MIDGMDESRTDQSIFDDLARIHGRPSIISVEPLGQTKADIG